MPQSLTQATKYSRPQTDSIYKTGYITMLRTICVCLEVSATFGHGYRGFSIIEKEICQKFFRFSLAMTFEFKLKQHLG